ncbi:IS200/IS605 family accessory protein TnpB-related protein [Streptomyces seoulensis]|uniref:IS200/IS605 family accessory protein TnpB-related protein n=1 Tax=Streptomyces seoulensis TaxID=73044 RepID=UPI003C2C6E1F
MGRVREVAVPYVVPAPAGVAARDRLKGLSRQDERVLRHVGDHLGALASRDLKARCIAGSVHGADAWAERKRVLTAESSSRWAGAITKATNDQWALARRGQLAHVRALEAEVCTVARRLALPLRAAGDKRAAGGYRSRREWFAKSRRLRMLEDRLRSARADWRAGVVHVVRGGRRLLHSRQHLAAAGLTEQRWRERWETGRRFLQADGETGKRFGNETIRVTPDGEVSIRLPAPLVHLANAPHGRYVLAGRVTFPHRGRQWRERVSANRAVAYRVHENVDRGRWYLTASWKLPSVRTAPLAVARANGLVGVDTNADHFAAWRLDAHGNPVGRPFRFGFDLTGTAEHRDAQIRHALTRLLHWAKRHDVAIAIEDLDFSAEKTREKHGGRKRFRALISGMPVARVRSRLVAMAAEMGIAMIAVDPAYTSRWGAQHWQKPLTGKRGRPTRHDAASIAIGRRALGFAIRRRAAPPRDDRSDRRGHRSVQVGAGTRGREETRPRLPGPRTRFAGAGSGAKAGDQGAHHRSGRPAEPESRQRDSMAVGLNGTVKPFFRVPGCLGL